MKICFKALVLVWFATMSLLSWAQSVGPRIRVDSIQHDTDLWTNGQLILFSCKEPLLFDEHGRVVSGMLGINTMILCADSKFREFARDYHVSFDEKGLLQSGTMANSIEIVVQEQPITSMSYTEVAFFSNGVVKYFVPSNNFRYTTSDGFKFAVLAGNRVIFDEYGRLRTATIARRRILQKADGTEKVYHAGDVINLDHLGTVAD
ncbi:MAG: hypothetical protein K6F33_14045 [Bacteroidales bacterium]|nr:hypothetical protein [Bacteroidales bacterium]